MFYQSIGYKEFGRPQDVVTIIQKQRLPLLADEVEVEMILAPINPSDLIPMTGAYRSRTTLPATAGFEGVGIVRRIGENVPTQLLWKRVLPLREEGTWQQFVKTNWRFAVVVPDELDNFTAATSYINPLTAWLIVTRELQLQKGDTLVMNAGGGAIGRIFASLARIIGFKYIAIVQSVHNHEELLALGASKLVTDISQVDKVTAAIDCLGGEFGTLLATCVQPGGTFLSLGLLLGEQVNWQSIHQLPIQARLFHLRFWNERLTTCEWQGEMRKVMDLLVSGQLPAPKIGDIFSFRDVRKALESVNRKVFLDFTS